MHKPGERTLAEEKFRVRAALRGSAVDDGEDVVHLREEVQRVRDEDAGLARGRVQEHVVEHGLADVRVQRGEGVVEDLYVCINVDRAAYVDSLLLAAGEGDALG